MCACVASDMSHLLGRDMARAVAIISMTHMLWSWSDGYKFHHCHLEWICEEVRRGLSAEMEWSLSLCIPYICSVQRIFLQKISLVVRYIFYFRPKMWLGQYSSNGVTQTSLALVKWSQICDWARSKSYLVKRSPLFDRPENYDRRQNWDATVYIFLWIWSNSVNHTSFWSGHGSQDWDRL